MASCWITVGYSAHRVETLDAFERAAGGHRVVVLEEPPTSGFGAMLEGSMSVAEHLDEVFPEFPVYSERQCEVLRRLHDGGVEVVQIEPFLSELEAIHDGFERGSRPEDLEAGTTRWRVYQAERRWTGALLGYYAASGGPDFDRVVDAVCRFARIDAERGRLRDVMRARRVVELLPDTGGAYVEAGYLHTRLIRELRCRAPYGVPVRPRWLMASVVRGLDGCSMHLAPGDRLTVSYAHGHTGCDTADRLLAARSLIQIALTVKDELVPTVDAPHPHIADEIATIGLVDRLGYDDCRRLYPRVKRAVPAEARELVEAHLG
jgi:hypothetical protein